MRHLLVLAGFGTLALACGGGHDDSTTTLAGAPLDCAWLMSNNCWKTTVAAAASCLPDPSTSGVLSADGSTCTYASGTNVTFETPLKLPVADLENQPPWHFTVTTGGQECVTYDENPNSTQTLDVQGMTYSDKTVGIALQITCPDGSQFAAQNALNLLECSDFFTDSPGYEDNPTDTSMRFAFLNGTDTPLQVFDCEQATTN
ncbi:MAG TPA: hypothetical protein VMI54_08230 [Polyangiaceae bacterium]|nr:hypothetical protein [Polyangiaceae bacterium]